MKDYLIATLGNWLKVLAGVLRDLPITGITHTPSLPAFPDIEWELHGNRNTYLSRIRAMARFFFMIGCLTLGLAVCIYLWQLVSNGS